MKFAQPTGRPAPPSGTFSRNEKIKLALMVGGVLLVGGLILFGLSQSKRYDAEKTSDLPADAHPMEETSYVPDIDGARVHLPHGHCTPEETRIGLPVEFVFRRIHESGGRPNYYWKASPVPAA